MWEIETASPGWSPATYKRLCTEPGWEPFAVTTNNNGTFVYHFRRQIKGEKEKGCLTMEYFGVTTAVRGGI